MAQLPRSGHVCDEPPHPAMSVSGPADGGIAWYKPAWPMACVPVCPWPVQPRVVWGSVALTHTEEHRTQLCGTQVHTQVPPDLLEELMSG